MFAVVVAYLAGCSDTQAPSPADAVAGPVGVLGHDGRWLVDQTGRVVGLHGVNYVKKFPPIPPAEAGFDADDAALMQAQGLNVVRLGAVFGALMPSPGQIDTHYVESLADTVRVLEQEGIYVLLDFHQDGYGPLVHGNGFPEWATLTDGLPNPPDPFPTYYVTNPAMQRAFDNFWENRAGPDGVPLQQHYAEAIHAVAAAVGHEPLVLGYDLMNEPWPGATYQSCFAPGCPDIEAARLVPFGERMVEAIRSVDPAHLVFTEPFVLFNFGQADTSLAGIGGPASAISFHVYAATPELDAAVIDRAIAASAHGDAIVGTEFGATPDPATIRRLTTDFDTRLVPWIFWSWDGNVIVDPAQPPSGDNVHAPALAAITRPFATATNGTPTSSSYDPDSGVFDQEWSTTRPDGSAAPSDLPTTIAVPPSAYPAGYTAQVTGGSVLSEPCAPVLVIRNASDAATVRAHVTPGGCTR